MCKKKQVSALTTGLPSTWGELGDVLTELGDLDGAADAYDQCLAAMDAAH